METRNLVKGKQEMASITKHKQNRPYCNIINMFDVRREQYDVFRCWYLTSSAKIGRKMVAVATLLVTSVKVAVRVLSIRTRIHFGKDLKLTNRSPIIADNPDTCLIQEKHNTFNILISNKSKLAIVDFHCKERVPSAPYWLQLPYYLYLNVWAQIYL